jgi:hypothetical protein
MEASMKAKDAGRDARGVPTVTLTLPSGRTITATYSHGFYHPEGRQYVAVWGGNKAQGGTLEAALLELAWIIEKGERGANTILWEDRV